MKDKQEEIDTILWTVTSKVRAIIKTPNDSLKNIYFDYDALGSQIAKHVYNAQTLMLEKSTYYILDAKGDQLSVYEHSVDSSSTSYYLTERNIYGKSRLGTIHDTINLFNPIILPSYGVLGNRFYEMTDHRNNVYTVINDIKIPLDENSDTYVDGYLTGIVNVTDFSPFNVELDGRTIERGNYRYSVQGQEHDDEIRGKGNYINYKYRGYDPRIGRLGWAIDPMTDRYPWNSPYAFSENRVIDGIELEGLEVKLPVATKWSYDKGNNGFDQPLTFVGNSFVSAYNGVAGVWNFLSDKDDITDIEQWKEIGQAIGTGLVNTKNEIEWFANDPVRYLQSLNTDDLENLLGAFLIAKGVGKVVKLGEVTVKAPLGNLIIGEGMFSESELNAAEYMRKFGKEVELRQPKGKRSSGGETSDLVVDGKTYDVYTPETSNINRIVSAIRKKNNQATGVVVDLSRSNATTEQLSNILKRVQGAGGTNITDIKIMPKTK